MIGTNPSTGKVAYGLFEIDLLGTKFDEIWIKVYQSSAKKSIISVSSAKMEAIYRGLIVLK